MVGDGTVGSSVGRSGERDPEREAEFISESGAKSRNREASESS